jgi:hypothetical protein
MRTTSFRGSEVSERDVIDAIRRFDAEHRSPKWKRYAVEYESKQYPPKEILRMASGFHGKFSGGESTNRVFRDLGFAVIERDEEALTDDEALDEALEITFKLEEDLERFLAKDLIQLEDGLRLYTQDARRGQQMNAGAAGRVDLLAVDSHGGFVVVELKAGEADRQACGQIQAYMAWISDNLASGSPVRGILVAGDFTERCKLAAKVVPGLSLKQYSAVFKFTDP